MIKTNIEDIIEEKYTRYLNCETDIIELTLEEAIFILEKDKKNHYVEELLQEAYKVILSDYKRVLKENDCLKNHIHYKYCTACGKEFRTKRSDTKYCAYCSKSVTNKIYFANLTEEQKAKRREQSKLAMRKLRANK